MHLVIADRGVPLQLVDRMPVTKQWPSDWALSHARPPLTKQRPSNDARAISLSVCKGDGSHQQRPPRDAGNALMWYRKGNQSEVAAARKIQTELHTNLVAKGGPSENRCVMTKSKPTRIGAASPGSIALLVSKGTREDNKPIRLVFVDDDNDYREAATAELADLGFVVESFADGASMLAAVADGLASDVIVLDWGLPGMSGIDLLPMLGRKGIQLPVVVLTGRSSLTTEHLAFDRGAVDFVDKSRGVPILAKRIHAIVQSSKRSHELELDETERYGRLTLKPRVCRAFWDTIDVDLTLTEFKVVRLLASNLSNQVSHRGIYDCMRHVGFMAGHGDQGYRTNVRSTMKRIRNKFRLVDPKFEEIETYALFGYGWGRPRH